MTNSKKRKTLEEKKPKESDFFEIYNYCTGGYGGNHYVHLKNGKPGYYGESLTSRTIIEILWPNKKTSVHKITCETDSDSFYCRDACETFHTTCHYPFISIEHNGVTLGKVKLTSIKGIKARIISNEN